MTERLDPVLVSSPCRRGSTSLMTERWIPACAGMTPETIPKTSLNKAFMLYAPDRTALQALRVVGMAGRRLSDRARHRLSQCRVAPEAQTAVRQQRQCDSTRPAREFRRLAIPATRKASPVLSRPVFQLAPQITPSSFPTFTNAATACSSCSRVCAALIWVRIRALPWGTTGKLKPTT